MPARLYPDSPHPLARLLVESVVVVLGLAALTWAWHADLRYCERNLLFMYWAYDADERAKAVGWRLVGAALGAALLLVVRPLAGRWVGRRAPGEVAAASLRMGMGLALSLAASEVGLRVLHLPRKPDLTERTEVLIGEADPRYGWRYIASRSTTLVHGERPIEYAIDANHDRAATKDSAPDPALPTLLFTGESIAAGHGLAWDQTYAATVGRALDLQVVNLAVHGYASDQAFLRLYDELPRFAHPVAVVTIFLPVMVERSTHDDHPRLEFDGVTPKVVPVHDFWHDLRIAETERVLLPHWGDRSLESAAKIFRETDRLARERGAKAIFVSPRFDSSDPRRDAYLIRELFADQGLTMVDVDFRFEALSSRDAHPNAAAIGRLADALIATLRREIAQR